MAENDGWGSGLWQQLQQVQVTRDDGIRAPVRADGENGIVLGDPPIAPIAKPPALGRELLRRLKLRLARG